MNKNIKIILLVVLALCFIFFIGCEGPAGPAGADGVDGIDGTDGTDGADGIAGNVTCLVCHSEESLEIKRAQFAMSQHSVGDIAVAYAGSRASCAKCHSHEGFVQFALGFDAENIAYPSPWQCSTCHGLHQTFEQTDYALRLSDPVVAIFDENVTFLLKGNNTMDLEGGSNLCANCHQSRRGEPNLTNPGETFTITSTHYGPHHSAQANVVYGAGFAEIDGSVAYPEAGSSYHLAASCVGCHMSEFTDGEGGHSFNPSLAACNNCHTTADFNYGGVQAEVDELLVELRDLLIAAGVVAGDNVDGYHPVKGTYPMAQARAFFNWNGLDEDRSLGAHNPKYVKALLKNSIDAM